MRLAPGAAHLHARHARRSGSLLGPKNIMLATFVAGMIFLAATSMSWRHHAADSVAGDSQRLSARLNRRGGSSSARDLREGSDDGRSKIRQGSIGGAGRRGGAAGSGKRSTEPGSSDRLMLASHGRLMWYFPGNDTVKVLHEGEVRQGGSSTCMSSRPHSPRMHGTVHTCAGGALRHLPRVR
jgi:hypothetical protein